MSSSDTLILTHCDCDGICAGAIALSRFPGARIFFTKPVSFLHDFREVALDAGIRNVIICDMALTKRDAKEIMATMKKARAKVMYFDHHVIPQNISWDDVNRSVNVYKHDPRASASEIIFRYFQKSVPKERVWLALYGAIGDYTDNTDFAEQRIRNWDRRALYFEVSSLIMGIKERRFSGYDAKRRLVQSMSSGKNPSEMAGLVDAARKAVEREFDFYEIVKSNARKSGKIGYIKDPPEFGFRGPSALFAATVKNAPVGLCMYTRRGYIDITARTRSDDPSIVLNRLMELGAEKVGGSGGGLPKAAGARIPQDKLSEFLKIINQLF